MLEGILSEWEQQLSECDQRVVRTAFGHFLRLRLLWGFVRD